MVTRTSRILKKKTLNLPLLAEVDHGKDDEDNRATPIRKTTWRNEQHIAAARIEQHDVKKTKEEGEERDK